MTGYDIYARAVQTWSLQPESPFVSYDVVATLRRRGRVREERSRVLFRTADRTGITQSTTGRTTFGRPRFVPDVAFRLVPRSVNAVDGTLEAPSPQASATPPATIGRVVVPLKRYDVLSSDEETYQGHSVYHLVLAPLFDPKRNGVRQMWVDTQTFVTWRLVNETPYAVGLARGTFLLDAEYAPVRSTWLLNTVTTSGAVRFGFFAYGGDAEIRFLNIATSTQGPPAYCFQRDGFEANKMQCGAALR